MKFSDSNVRSCTVILITILISISAYAQDYLSGRVFNGNKGDESTPISGVTVRLYGSADQGVLGSQIGSTTTNSSGWYQLLAPAGYEFYNIVETDPSGYVSVDASSVSGTKVNANRIRYSIASQPLSSQTKTGNKFWDKPESTPNNPPVADANGPYTGSVGQSVTLDGTGSTDPDGDALTYAWDLDLDGQYDDATGAQPGHTWNSPYTGSIGLRVTDSHGATDTDQASVIISAAPAESGTIRGRKFQDDNKNGTEDTGESPLSGWRIYLDLNKNNHYDTGEPSDVTGQLGNYSITASPGTYDLREVMQPGWTASTAEEVSVTIVRDQVITQDFGNYQTDEENEFDYGDAPDSYRTLSSNNGAFHTIDSLVFIGTAIDAEADGQPDANARGDNLHGTDDETGVSFIGNFVPGDTVEISVEVKNNHFTDKIVWIAGWIDFNQDGSWDSVQERFSPIFPMTLFVPAQGAARGHVLTIVPNGPAGNTFLRVRMYCGDEQPKEFLPWGDGGLGEVQDYQIEMKEAETGSVTVVKESTPADDTVFWFCEKSTGFFNLFCFPLSDPSDSQHTSSSPSGIDEISESMIPGWVLKEITIQGDTDNGCVIDVANRKVTLDYDPGENIIIIFKNAKSEDGGGIMGRKWHDMNRDGNSGPGEPGLPEWTIWLDVNQNGVYDASDLQTQTNPIGVYSFSGVNPGSYIVGEMLQSGWNQTFPAGNGMHTVTVSASQMILDVDFGNTHEAYSPDELDYGDAPVPYSMPQGLTVNPAVCLGKDVDADSGPQPHANALGDDQDGNDDEDGVQLPVSFTPGQNAQIQLDLTHVTVPNSPQILLSFDFNRDGDMSDAGEYFNLIASSTGGVMNLSIPVPSTAKAGSSFMTVMLVDRGPVPPNGSPYGEIEEYEITIDGAFEGYDFGDAPASYPTLMSSNGARHRLPSSLYLGSRVDAEPDGLPTINADGDDLLNTKDEDGVTMPSVVTQGQTVSITVTASDKGFLAGWMDFNADGDWQDQGERIIILQSVSAGSYTFAFQVPANAVIGQTYARFRVTTSHHISVDGEDFDGEVEDYAVAIQEAGTGSITIIKEATPADDTPFWISVVYGIHGGAAPYRDPSSNTSVINNGPAGTYSMGESVPAGWTLKDIVVQGDTDNGSVVNLAGHAVSVDLDAGENITVTFQNEKIEGLDFGDAPAGFPAASHALGGPYWGWSGDAPDADATQQSHPQARGDDDDGSDDEDGIITTWIVRGHPWGGGSFHCPIATGSSGYFTIGVWIDFNNNGSFADPGEQAVNYTNWNVKCPIIPNSPPILYSVGFPIPTNAHVGKVIARMRIYEGPNVSISYSGSAGPGEVEDHLVEIINYEDPSKPGGGSIVGTKWNDMNNNGTWDAGESPLSGWKIWLDLNQNGVEDAGDSYDITDGSGQFMFSVPAPGAYLVGEEMKPGWSQTWPGGPGTQSVNVTASGVPLPALFGNYQTDPESGDGSALKWNQPPMFEAMDEDTSCYQGWLESSVYSESYVADDWYCSDARPVTQIRWWGSYADWDSLTPPEQAPEYFHLGIWNARVLGDDNYESQPEELIHEWFLPREEVQETRLKCYWTPEQAKKPMAVYRYTFDIPEDAWFHQEGPVNIYWLHVAAVYEELPEMNRWGWLTREHYFHNDAVRIMQPLQPHPGMGFEDGMPMAELWDMAFVLGTHDFEPDFDFGDIPDIGYGTLISRNGAQHLINPEIRLGDNLDADYDGQPHQEAQGDDDDGTDDDDGIEVRYPLTLDAVPQIMVHAVSTGYLNAWIDLNQNGSWADAEDHVIHNAELNPGDHVFDVDAFKTAEPGFYMSRFRFSTEPDLWFRGFAWDGEVEDYRLHIDFSSRIAAAGSIPKTFKLHKNYPNPFNPSTTIVYDLPERSEVEILIYNMTGQKVKHLIKRKQEPGSYQVRWRGTDSSGNRVSSGVYLCLFRAGKYRKVMKLIYIR
jgi:hypothetical protein